jgi:hypothetical protein
MDSGKEKNMKSQVKVKEINLKIKIKEIKLILVHPF